MNSQRFGRLSQEPTRASRRARARGLTLVELLISVAIGLAVMAAGLGMLVTALQSQQRVVRETRLMQELRTAQDAVIRSLRRAGHWSGAASSVSVSGSGAVSRNPLTELATADDGTAIGIHHSRDATVSDAATPAEQVGFRLRDGVVQASIGFGRWQALTDPGTLVVTRFQVLPEVRELRLSESCASECPDDSTTCPPRLLLRSATVEITGRSANDPRVLREVQSTITVRNDAIVGSCPP